MESKSEGEERKKDSQGQARVCPGRESLDRRVGEGGRAVRCVRLAPINILHHCSLHAGTDVEDRALLGLESVLERLRSLRLRGKVR
jgi:hypothetical protein